MLGNPRWCALSLMLWLATLAAPRAARACTVLPQCPDSRTIPADGGRLPANLHGFLWHPPCVPEGGDHDASLKAIAADGSTRTIDMQIDVSALGSDRGPDSTDLRFVHWNDELAPGTQLVFSFREPSPARMLGQRADEVPMVQRDIELFVTPAAALPDDVGVLSASTAYGTFRVSSRDGDCSHPLVARYVDLKFLVSFDAEPLSDAMYLETRVDDAPWTPFSESFGSINNEWLGGSALGRDRDRVYLPCALPDHSPAQFDEVARVLAPGHHSARMVGTLPDGTELSSSPYELELHCQEDDAADAAVADAHTTGVEKDLVADSGGCSVLGIARPRTPRALTWLGLGLCAALRSARRRERR